MGNGQSNELLNERRSNRSRQSTRSLPDNRGKKRHQDRSIDVNGVYSGADLNARPNEFWLKDAAPYYYPSRSQRTAGPRSLDLNVREGCDGQRPRTAVSRGQQQETASCRDDAWSDVASDMFRIRHNQDGARSKSSGRRKTPSYKRGVFEQPIRNVPIDERGAEVPSDASDSRRATGRHSSSRKRDKDRGYKLASSQSAYNSFDSGYQRSSIKPSSTYEFKRPLSPVDDNQYYVATSKSSSRVPKRGRPPLPPAVPAAAVAGERWVDGGPRATPTAASPPLPSLDRSRSRQTVASPPKSPLSPQCDKLIFQSLRAELTEERALRVEAERHAKELQARVEELISQMAGMDSCDSSGYRSGSEREKCHNLQSELQGVRDALRVSEESRERLSEDYEKQKALYDKCLDGVANSVAKALQQQKDLKATNDKLREQLLEVEWENRLLKAEMKIQGERPEPSFANSPNARLRSHMAAIRTGARGDHGPQALSTLFSSADSVVSTCSNHAVSGGSLASASPLVNAGEGLCSRPHSYNFDMSASRDEPLPPSTLPLAASSATMPPHRLHTMAAVPKNAAVASPMMLLGGSTNKLLPPLAPPPISRALKPLHARVDKAEEDLYEPDRVCNFAHQHDTDPDDSNSSSTKMIIAQMTSQCKVPFGSTTADALNRQSFVGCLAVSTAAALNSSGASSVERARYAAGSGSSIGSLAFVQSALLSSDCAVDTHTSTPKPSSPGAPLRLDRTLTPSDDAAVKSAPDAARLLFGRGEKPFDDGYSTLLLARPTSDAPAAAGVVKSASFDAAVRALYEDGANSAAAAASAESLEWDQLWVRALFNAAEQQSPERDVGGFGRGEKTSTSSGISSGADDAALPPFGDGAALFAASSLCSINSTWDRELRCQERDAIPRCVRKNSSVRLRRSSSSVFLVQHCPSDLDRALLRLSATRSTSIQSGSSCDLTSLLRASLRVERPPEWAVAHEALYERQAADGGDVDDMPAAACGFNSDFYALCDVAALAGSGQSTSRSETDAQTESCDSSTNCAVDRSRDKQMEGGRLLLETGNSDAASSSFTSDDSEDDGLSTVQAWQRQLRLKGAADKRRAVVRYNPPRTSVLRRELFTRFGEQERRALASFAFLNADETPQPPRSPADAASDVQRSDARRRRRRADAGKRLSRSWSDVSAARDTYENVHARPVAADVEAANGKGRQESEWRDGGRSSAEESGKSSADSYDSSLLLSDLCAAADCSLSSSSSISFHG